MDFEFMSYSGEGDAEKIAAAPARRQKGAALLNEVKKIKQEWHRIFEHAKVQGTKPSQVLEKFIRRNPAAIDLAKDYVRSRGIVPSEGLHDLCLQYCRLRDAQINDVVDMYDVENYEEHNETQAYEGVESFEGEADNLFGRTGRKYRAKHGGLSRKEVRKLRRSNRRANKPEAGDNVIIPAEELLATAGDVTPGAELQTKQQQIDFNSPLPLPAFSTELPPVELQVPTHEEAEAEIIGEESDYESYEGEYEENLPALKAIDLLGRINYEAAEQPDNATGPDSTKPKYDWGKLFVQLSDSTTEAVKAAKALKAGKEKINAKDVVGQVKEAITEREKVNYAKDNAGTIIAVVAAIVVVGFLIGKA